MSVDFCKTNETKITAPKSALTALLVAAAGRHNILLVGRPGCGKTLLAQQIPLLSPTPTKDELQSVNRIYSIAGLLPQNGITEAPFRSPHQTVTLEGICGGGVNCRPGEISLAHNGILFLDEAAEFRSTVLQMLRVPAETHRITLSRAGRSSIYPADFQLVMTANPCPCGNYGTDEKICLCSEKAVEMYWKKISSPLIDRVDIVVRISGTEELAEHSLDELRQKIAAAVERQRKRGKRNARLSFEELHEATKCLDGKLEEHAIKDFTPRLAKNLRGVALTIADIENREVTEDDFIAAMDLRKQIFMGVEL